MESNLTLDNVINSDPTLRYFIKEATFDFENLEWQMSVSCAALKIAMAKWINLKYH
jgi:hypothetical protein